jgi:hypothetical protein
MARRSLPSDGHVVHCCDLDNVVYWCDLDKDENFQPGAV